MMKSPLKNLMQSALMLAFFCVPLLSELVRNCTLDIYKLLINAKLPSIAFLGQVEFFFNAVFESAAVACIGIYALIMRLIFGIDTSCKKKVFVAGLIFYLFAQQIILMVILLGIADKFDLFEWNIMNVWTSVLYLATLLGSMWLYRVLVGRNRTSLQMVLATMTQLILTAAAFSPVLFSTEASLYASFALLGVYIATAADIAFKGLAYKTAEGLLSSKFGKK